MHAKLSCLFIAPLAAAILLFPAMAPADVTDDLAYQQVLRLQERSEWEQANEILTELTEKKTRRIFGQRPYWQGIMQQPVTSNKR